MKRYAVIAGWSVLTALTGAAWSLGCREWF
jgi:hypothetical protein